MVKEQAKKEKREKILKTVQGAGKGVRIVIGIAAFLFGLLIFAVIFGIGWKLWEVIAPAFGF